MSIIIIFFYKKILNVKKHKQTANKTKNNPAKSNKGSIFLCTQASKRVEVAWFAFCAFCTRGIFLLKKKKKKQTWNWPDSLNSLYCWCLPLSTRLWNLYLQALIYICNHLWEFLLFMTVLFNESLFICDHLWESLLFMRIFISLSYFWKSLFL